MKKILLILLLYISSHPVYGRDSLLIVFWNVENFYDYIDDGSGESDREFSSYGSRHWTKKKFLAKCDAVAKSLFFIGERYGRMPDIIGLAEIENKGVLSKLLGTTLLRKYDYGIVHQDSKDRRGIDVALLYRKSVFKRVSFSFTLPEYEGRPMSTRDILQVCLEYGMGQKINLIVNHHPSKYGGSEVSAGRRSAAMLALRNICDSLEMVDRGVPVVAMGDFNDTPDGEQFGILSDVLANKADVLFKEGRGTIRYKGKWELIDMFMTSHDISAGSRMDIVLIPFLMTYDRQYPGYKPLRTYTGPRYSAGVSDHCPIVLFVK